MIVHAEFSQKNGGDETAEWLAARTGCLTSSEFGKFVCLDGSLRKGEMKESYLDEKLFERWTGRKMPNEFFTMAVNNGLIVEEKAAAFAAMSYGLKIQHVGFASNDAGTVGASPDGLIGWCGLSATKPTSFLDGVKVPEMSGIEIKCPTLKKHIGYVRAKKLPDDYICQVQGSMFVTGCQTWHFLSYPLACYLDGFPPLHLVIERDEKWQANFAESLDIYMEKFDAEFAKLVDLNGGLPKHRQQPELQPIEPSADGRVDFNN
jgi:hypothetical protein